jgi:hypothetical protein
MIARALRSGARVAGGGALAVLAACNSTPPALHGPPVLTGVYWIAGDTMSQVWSSTRQAAVVPSAPPFVSEIDFVFDRRLDGDRIEETFTAGGVAMTRPSSAPPVHVQWPELSSPWPTSSYTVQYNPLGLFGSSTSYVFLRPRVAGLPSDETVTFAFVLPRFANSYGESLASPSFVAISTSTLTVSVSVPSAAVAGTYQLPLAFSNRMSLSSRVSTFIHVRAGQSDVPYALVADANVASRWYVAPADCLGRWPASTTFTVVVDPGLPDVFGGKLSLGATTTFKTGSGAEGAPDCGATIVGDAAAEAALDAGATEAGVDVVGFEAGATDAGGPADAGAADAGAADVAFDAELADATASS